MTFSQFAAQVLQPLEATTKKLAQTQILAQALTELDSPEISPALYLILGQIGPTFRRQRFQFGREFLLTALAQVQAGGGAEAAAPMTDLFGVATAVPRLAGKQQLKKRWQQLGDVGELAQEVVAAAVPSARSSFTIGEVYDHLEQLTLIAGVGSQEERITHVVQLLQSSDSLAGRYIARILLGDTRLGVSDKTMLDAISWMLAGDKSLRPALDAVYQIHPDIGAIATRARTAGLAGVQQLDVTLGVPILPALCDRLKSTQEMINKMGEVLVEPKYDGTRVQIHWRVPEELHTFTRNLEENTHMFPELKPQLSQLDAREIILDAEAVGYDPQTGELVVFQQTIKRKRKHDIWQMSQDIPLRFFVFDILYLDGQSLLQKPLHERRARLQQVVGMAQLPDLVVSPAIVSDQPDVVKSYHEQQLAAGLEGIVVKRTHGVYQPGRQAFNWVKLKEREGSSAKLSDTIDVVVLGSYYGRGKRTAFGLGAFLVGVLDPDREQIVSVAKIGTGLTDEQWREMKQRLDMAAGQTAVPPALAGWSIMIPDMLQPDVSVPPQIVVEVAADEITQSPTHTAGVALRFPRLVRFRDDKLADQATTVAEVKKIM